MSNSDPVNGANVDVLDHEDVNVAPEDILCVRDLSDYHDKVRELPVGRMFYVLIDRELDAGTYVTIKNFIEDHESLRILDPRPMPYHPVIRVQGIRSVAELEQIISEPGQTVTVRIAVNRVTYDEYCAICALAVHRGYIVLDQYPRMNVRRGLASYLLDRPWPWWKLTAVFALSCWWLRGHPWLIDYKLRSFSRKQKSSSSNQKSSSPNQKSSSPN